MTEIEYIDYLYNHDKIVCSQYLIDLVQPILLKKRITKKEYDFVISVLNFCNLIYRNNKKDETISELRKITILYFSILFRKTLER